MFERLISGLLLLNYFLKFANRRYFRWGKNFSLTCMYILCIFFFVERNDKNISFCKPLNFRRQDYKIKVKTRINLKVKVKSLISIDDS